jgi:hypothetical protein
MSSDFHGLWVNSLVITKVSPYVKWFQWIASEFANHNKSISICEVNGAFVGAAFAPSMSLEEHTRWG